MRLLALIPFTLALACSDDTGDPGAPAKCRTMVSAMCSRIVACDSTEKQAPCEADLQTTLPCTTAIGVSSSYDSCLQTINRLTCTELADLTSTPAACQGSILVPEKK